MSKKDGEFPYNPKIEVDVNSVNHLLGKILTQADLLGLGDKQHKAYRSTLYQLVWDWYNKHMDNETGLADPSKQARIEAGIELTADQLVT